jgi:hypothetical protein
MYPGCDHGTCVAIELPRPTECATDADCTLSCLEPQSCCAGCACETPWNKADLARADQWRAEQCGGVDCPQAKCIAPTKVAKCSGGWCVAD